MQHYHDVIAAAKQEVLLASNAWEPGRSVELVTSAIRKLNERCARDNQKVDHSLPFIISSGFLSLTAGCGEDFDRRCKRQKCHPTSLLSL